MLAHLVACPSCARHVRATDAACPFCCASLDLRAVPAPRPPAARMSRAALAAFALASACSTSSGGTEAASSTSGGHSATCAATSGVSNDCANTGASAAYGLPPDTSTSHETSSPSSFSSSSSSSSSSTTSTTRVPSVDAGSCNPTTQYATLTDGDGGTQTGACDALPPECMPGPTCACVEEWIGYIGAGYLCTVAGDGLVLVEIRGQ